MLRAYTRSNKTGAVFDGVWARNGMPGARLTCTPQPAACGVLNETPQGVRWRDFMEHESGELSPERIASGSRRGE